MTETSPTFASLSLCSSVQDAIDKLGWTSPTPVQLQAYKPAVEGKDLIIQSQTGTGKTGAFAIPLVDSIVKPQGRVQALVLAPTRELAIQSATQIQNLAAGMNLKAMAVYGGAPIQKQIDQLKQGIDIISGTPGRVLDHLSRGTLDPKHIETIVLDEADEMLSMGFIKELNKIMQALSARKRTWLFSATIDKPLQRIADRYLKDPEIISLSSDSVGARSIKHFSYMISGFDRLADLKAMLSIEEPGSAIIFCNRKSDTEKVSAFLKKEGFKAAWINGDLAQAAREKVLKQTREGKIQLLVATDVAARGIDISHLTHVINYELPNHVEQYVHRTGRTGRAGKTGTAINLISPQELGTLYYIRLLYQIDPVERTLPTATEEQTLSEIDQINILTKTFNNTPLKKEHNLLARRILTHVDAEKLVAHLLQGFFIQKNERPAQHKKENSQKTERHTEPAKHKQSKA